MKLRTKRAIVGMLLMAITAMQLSTIIRQEALGLAMCWGGFYKGGYLQ